MPIPLRTPTNLGITVEGHQKWLQLLKETKMLIDKDDDLQKKAAKGVRLKERRVPPEVLGGVYAKYCDVINRMYHAYVGSEQLQRAEYIKDLISVLMRRMFELRNELVNLIVTDYLYLDSGLIQQRMIPQDIEIVVPYHLALEARKDSVEELLQSMWAESVQRLTAPVMVHASTSALYNRRLSEEMEGLEAPPAQPSESTIIITEDYIQATIIQTYERYRRYFMRAFKAKCIDRRTYYKKGIVGPPKHVKAAAASIIQKVYRRYMEVKRERVKSHEANVFLGMVPDPWANLNRLNLREETNKLHSLRRRINERTRQAYMRELEAENTRLIRVREGTQIDDITEHIREWFKEWYYGYGFFPEYPYEIEGGTIMLLRGTYPTIDEKIEMDQKLAAAMKGKTKDMLKAEKEQAAQDAINKAILEAENLKKLKENEFKMKCNPFADPGYKVQQSKHMQNIFELLQKYNDCWSIYDKLSPEVCAEIVYGYIVPILTEELMSQMHVECRRYVDELMRLEWKLMIEAHKQWYNTLGQKFPKMKPRKRPPAPKPPKPEKVVDNEMLQGFEYLFDLGIITKPTGKIDDIMGDSNYSAYDQNIADPNASFPLPGYGDIRNRLVLSCVCGSGLEPQAVRNRSVLLVGPARNGKSFLVDCVAGEMNAVKIDISPEVFSAVVARPGKGLGDVFQAAKVFQPCVVYMRNVERVFFKKIPPEQKHLKARSMKKALTKYVKAILPEDRVIFIATCSTTIGFKAKPMTSVFDEIILVPRTDYGTLQMFFYNKLQSIRSMPRDYCVAVLAKLLQGYGFGAIIETFNKYMSAERIIRLNVTPFTPDEITDAMEGHEQLSVTDYQVYADFCLQNSPLSKPREELMAINAKRADVYTKMAKKMKADKEKKEKEKK